MRLARALAAAGRAFAEALLDPPDVVTIDRDWQRFTQVRSRL